MRERLTGSTHEAADILAEIENLEKKIKACDDAGLAAKADEIAKEEKQAVGNPQKTELKDNGDQNAKANDNWPLSDAEKVKVALRIVKLANALLEK